MDSRSSCEVIYKHCFLKLKPSIRSLRIDSKTLLVGFSEEYLWPLGEVPLEIIIREGLLTITKTLNFVIMRSDSPQNLLLGRIDMQKIGIVVSTIHGTIKVHTPKGIGTLLSEKSSQRPVKEQKTTNEAHQVDKEDILSCVDAKEKIVELLKAYADVFVWTTAHITGVPRTLIVGGEIFNIEHRVNESKHVEPVKQKKRSLSPERNEAIHT
nr:hypothetical protein [Tanacetum cinerariifolium]